MKYLKIKNRTGSPLYFVFCTLSSCTCEVCNEWITCEKAPIAGRPGATFGELRVEPFAERVDRFCWRWQCKGACYYDEVPSTVNWSALYDYDTSQDYSVGTGKADLSFTYSGASDMAFGAPRMKYLLLKNHSAEPLYFVYCTTSQCRCNICQEWLQFETVPVVDCASWTIGFVRVEPFSTKMERFCAQWDCMGCCFFGSQPHAVTKAMLFDYDENTNYTIGGGKAALEFTHTAPESSAPESSARQSGLKLATTVGRVALAFAGVPDVGVLGDVAGFVGSIFGSGP